MKKNKKIEYGRNRYHNMSKNKNQDQKDYRAAEKFQFSGQ